MQTESVGHKETHTDTKRYRDTETQEHRDTETKRYKKIQRHTETQTQRETDLFNDFVRTVRSFLYSLDADLRCSIFHGRVIVHYYIIHLAFMNRIIDRSTRGATETKTGRGRSETQTMSIVEKVPKGIKRRTNIGEEKRERERETERQTSR